MCAQRPLDPETLSPDLTVGSISLGSPCLGFRVTVIVANLWKKVSDTEVVQESIEMITYVTVVDSLMKAKGTSTSCWQSLRLLH